MASRSCVLCGSSGCACAAAVLLLCGSLAASHELNIQPSGSLQSLPPQRRERESATAELVWTSSPRDGSVDQRNAIFDGRVGQVEQLPAQMRAPRPDADGARWLDGAGTVPLPGSLANAALMRREQDTITELPYDGGVVHRARGVPAMATGAAYDAGELESALLSAVPVQAHRHDAGLGGMVITPATREEERLQPEVVMRPTFSSLAQDSQDRAASAHLQLAPAPASAPTSATAGTAAMPPQGSVQLTLQMAGKDLPHLLETLGRAVPSPVPAPTPSVALTYAKTLVTAGANQDPGEPAAAAPDKAAAGSTPAPDRAQQLPAPSPMPKADTSDDAMKGLPLFCAFMLCFCCCCGTCGFAIWKFCFNKPSNAAAQPSGAPLLAPSQAGNQNARSYRQQRKQGQSVMGQQAASDDAGAAGSAAPPDNAAAAGNAPESTEPEQHF